MPDDWFALPPYEYQRPAPDGSVFIAPKYVNDLDTGVSRDDLEGWTGNTVTLDPDTHDVPFAGQEVYIVRVYGMQAALDEIATHEDAYGMTEYGLSEDAVASYLNDALSREHTFDEWLDRFGVTTE